MAVSTIISVLVWNLVARKSRECSIVQPNDLAQKRMVLMLEGLS